MALGGAGGAFTSCATTTEVDAHIQSAKPMNRQTAAATIDGTSQLR
jgi:hypothetical protein